MTTAPGHLLQSISLPASANGPVAAQEDHMENCLPSPQITYVGTRRGEHQIYLDLSQPHAGKLSGTPELCWRVLHISLISNLRSFPLAQHLVEQDERFYAVNVLKSGYSTAKQNITVLLLNPFIKVVVLS